MEYMQSDIWTPLYWPLFLPRTEVKSKRKPLDLTFPQRVGNEIT